MILSGLKRGEPTDPRRIAESGTGAIFAYAK
jgi:hypothetical protein